MNWLNYHHLLYFWVVAREGTIAQACEQLKLTQPTITAQIRALERALGQKLFTRVGRHLQMTDTGQMVYRYADDIFSLGKELVGVLEGRPADRPIRFDVGVADVLPKLIACRLLEPALRLPERIQIVCQEGKPEDLLAKLALHTLDLVLSDAPISPQINVRAYNHLFGECGVSIFGKGNLARKYRRGFPGSLQGAPFLLPTMNTCMRRSLEQWFDSESINPTVKAEFEDSALLKAFGQRGVGLFPVPTAIEKEVRQQYEVQLIGRLDLVRCQFYGISVEKRLKHPAVIAISDVARTKLFG